MFDGGAIGAAFAISTLTLTQVWRRNVQRISHCRCHQTERSNLQEFRMNKSRILSTLFIVFALALSSLASGCSSESGAGMSNAGSSGGSAGGY
jgi:hypothetical protein